MNTLETPICKRCGRKLRNSKAVELGMGETCWKKYLAQNNHKPLFPREVKSNHAGKQ